MKHFGYTKLYYTMYFKYIFLIRPVHRTGYTLVNQVKWNPYGANCRCERDLTLKSIFIVF